MTTASATATSAAVATSDAKENDAPKSTAIPERDYGPEAEIARLQAQADAFTRKTELEKRAVRDLEKEVETMRSRVETQRKKMGGLDAAQRANNQIQKKIKMLETKLDKSLCRFNEAKSHNKTLRLTIDNLRKERAVFAEVYRKLEKDLDAKKADMGVIVEESDRAYEARDRAVAEMAKLKMQADKEQASFENEWRELGKLIEHDRKMKEFMRNRRKVNEDDGKLGTLSLEEEKKLKKKIIKGNWGNIKTKARQSTVQTKVHSYTEAFEKIKAAAGIDDLDALVSNFLSAEDENFRLFNYVNTLNQEIDALEEQISNVKGEIEKYRGDGVGGDGARKKQLKELSDKLLATERKADAYETKHKDAMKTVLQLKDGIWKIYNKIGCNTPANRELLGEEGVNTENMMQYLGIVEQRTNEILQMYAAAQATAKGEASDENRAVDDKKDKETRAMGYAALLSQGPDKPATGGTTLKIQLPTTRETGDEDSDESDVEDDRPLNRDELRAKTLSRLAKRERAAEKEKTHARAPSGGIAGGGGKGGGGVGARRPPAGSRPGSKLGSRPQ
ncbi:outer dynein arm docking complex 2 [Micromonas pusilla CCMP1545]|uniref:Outer dynein arm docking complex 2 n=1 Tax=Micromonas pusilla (strain CCMP1545) TaxID=564608 RepID=C1MI04_MICPC|nr:outer dynein arm docking complex 2 [Micromonas pusilla CCMP1545]EEH60297.1 outer dynein arm docking complex 2 [Micromonas pusilla CCMP1545]|eukprot:XP_003055045.1 outer dynein arm docking complex 2 [Micromonas pusilla CCMP1545]